MQNQDKLTNLLLNHWQKHQPTMFQQFQRENRLQEELEAAAEQFSERLYDLIVIQKLSYQSAWEMTIDAMLKGEPQEDEFILTHQSQPQNPHAILE